MTDPNPAARDTSVDEAHARHDATLIAAHVGGGLDDRAAAAARDVLAACPRCAELAVDLRVIAAATRRLPARRVPAGRSFTLDARRAAELSRRRRLLAVLRPFGRGGVVPARPIGVALSALGLVGLLVSTGAWIAPGFQTAGAPERDGVHDTTGTPDRSHTPTTQGGGKADATPLPPGWPDAEGLGPEGAGGGVVPTAAPDDARPGDASTGGERDVGPFLVLSGILVVCGVTLLVLRRAAIRLT